MLEEVLAYDIELCRKTVRVETDGLSIGKWDESYRE